MTMTTPELERAVLVGGTGRSGTTIAGRVLNHHPALALTVPRELRFLTGKGGIIDTLGPLLPGGEAAGTDARIDRDRDPEHLALRMRRRFYRWRKPSGIKEGLHRTVAPDVLDAALDAYLVDAQSDPIGASRRLVFAIIPSTLRSRAGRRWVDSTPTNTQLARALHAFLPQATIVHMMRDGRDVAVSFSKHHFGPDDPLEALELWGERMLRSFAEEVAVPSGVVVRVDLADWVGPDGLDHLHTLCDALGIERDPVFERWFSAKVTSDAMHGGRWRRDLRRRTANELDRRYAQWCAVLSERYPQFPLPRAN